MKFLERHKHSLLITALVVILLLLASLIYISKVDKYYSKINGIATTRTFYQNLEKYYHFQDTKNKVNKPLSSYADTAKNAIISNNAYVSEAKIAGLDYSQAATDKYMKQYYDINGGKEQYYHYVSTQYGESKEIANYINQTTYLQDALKDKIFSKNKFFGITMRWDMFVPENKTMNDKIQQNLKDNFLPLFKSGTSSQDIIDQVDKYNSENSLMAIADTPPIGYTSINNLLDRSTNDSMFFDNGGGGVSNLDATKKLNVVGQNTGIFKSTVGYYAIFRLESQSKSKYSSESRMIEFYSQKAVYVKSLSDIFNKLKMIIAKPFGLIFGSKVYAVALSGTSCFNDNTHLYQLRVHFIDSATNQEVSPNGASIDQAYQ